MRKLQALYPDARIARKRAETDATATNYVQSLYGFLPCLDLTDDMQRNISMDILALAGNIARVQGRISGETTQPLQGVAVSEPEQPQELTEGQKLGMAMLIQKHGIYAAQDPDTKIIYVTHDSIQGKAQALNEVELYEIVCDIAEQAEKENNKR